MLFRSKNRRPASSESSTRKLTRSRNRRSCRTAATGRFQISSRRRAICPLLPIWWHTRLQRIQSYRVSARNRATPSAELRSCLRAVFYISTGIGGTFSSMVMTPDILADIFLGAFEQQARVQFMLAVVAGNITRCASAKLRSRLFTCRRCSWADPRLEALNPTIKLPNVTVRCLVVTQSRIEPASARFNFACATKRRRSTSAFRRSCCNVPWCCALLQHSVDCAEQVQCDMAAESRRDVRHSELAASTTHQHVCRCATLAAGALTAALTLACSRCRRRDQPDAACANWPRRWSRQR